MNFRHFALLVIATVCLYPAPDCRAQNMDYVRSVLNRLTAPDMHGRGYVNRGDSLAAAFIARQFDSLSVKPFPGSGYMQPFPMPVNTFPGKLSLIIGPDTLKPGTDFIIGAGSPSAKGIGTIRPLDTLIFSSEKARSKFLSRSLAGTLPLYDHKFARNIHNLPAKLRKHLLTASGLIEIDDKLTHTVSGITDTLPVFKIIRKAYKAGANTAKFEVESKLIPRYLSQNVLGYLAGSSRPDSFIVLCAHYDHLGRMGKDTYFPGANDNAGGISMLLALASYYSRPENRPPFSIAFMAFGGEEAGLLGSRFYTEHARFPLSQIRFLINMDLVGTGEDGINTVNGTLYTKQFSRLQELNAIYKYLPSIKARGRAANSDHFYFSENDVPAFFVYTMGGIQAYHDVYDRPETLPLTKFKELYGLLIAFVEDLQQQH